MQRVAVIGAGWAGLACAIAAAGAGAQVDVFEQRAAWREAPGHLDVVPNMMRSLASLGLAERCVRIGFPYRGLISMDASGSLCAELPRVRLAGPQLPATLGLTAQCFSEALQGAARARGVRIHRSSAVETIDFDHGAAVLRLAGGARLRPDLAVLASGAQTRFEAMPFVAASPAPQVTWWCGLIPRPAGLDQPTLVLAAPGSKAMLVPVSGETAGLALMDAQLHRLPDTALDAGRCREWLRARGGKLAQTASLVTDPLGLLPVRVSAALRAGPWQRGNLLCVGDAAHVMPQHLGQSAAQAMEDAVVLGELLSGAAEAAGLPGAFERRRRPRVEAVFEVAMRAEQWDRAPDGHTGLAELSTAMRAAVLQPP